MCHWCILNRAVKNPASSVNRNLTFSCRIKALYAVKPYRMLLKLIMDLIKESHFFFDLANNDLIVHTVQIK